MNVVWRSSAIVLLVLLRPAPSQAEQLKAERAFADPDLSGPVVRGAQLSPDGRMVTFLKPKDRDQTVLDLWAVPSVGGAPKLLIDADRLESQGAMLDEVEKATRERQRIFVRGIVEYSWDAQSRAIVVPAAGDVFLFDVGSGKINQLTHTPATEVNVAISPLGHYVSYVRDGNLYLNSRGGGHEMPITSDAHDAISYGLAEFVAQEEMARFTGYWWSPDDQRIAFTRVDETQVDTISRLDISASGSTNVEQRYPRAGRPNAEVELYIAAPAGTGRVKVDLGADPDIYLARVQWSADGSILYVQRENRAQTRLDLLAVNPQTGESHVALSEQQKPWIDITDNLTPLKDGRFLWGSQRSGFNHLYLYDRQARLIRQVTNGRWVVVGVNSGTGRPVPGVVHVDQAHQLVYFLANKDTPLEQHLYVTSYAVPTEPRRVTSGHGWWSASAPPGGSRFIGSYSDPLTPPQSAVYDYAGHRLRWIEENRLAAGHPYFPYLDHHVVPDFGTIKAGDGSDLYYALLKPKDFDPGRHYPAIVEVYGGPGVQDVTRRWRPLSEQILLNEGYVLFQIANRGGAGRGFGFASALAGHLGSVEVQDQITGLKWLKARAFVDPARVGLMGWSYGGYMTLRLLTDPDAAFRAGAAGAAPADWRLYDTHYTERFMGDPRVNGLAYEAASILPRLDRLTGRLLLMQGMADDNVGFVSSTAVMNRLQELSVPFDLMLYPGQRHVILTPARKLQQMRTYTEFFSRELKGLDAEHAQ